MKKKRIRIDETKVMQINENAVTNISQKEKSKTYRQ